MNTSQESSPILIGTCYGGPCDGETFQHQEEMKRVKIRDRNQPPQQHIYAHHEGLSVEHGKPIFAWEKIEPWKLGG